MRDSTEQKCMCLSTVFVRTCSVRYHGYLRLFIYVNYSFVNKKFVCFVYQFVTKDTLDFFLFYVTLCRVALLLFC